MRALRYDDLSRLLLLAAAVVVLVTFRDYGITHDERVEATYGWKLLDYYRSGFADRSALEYLDLWRYGGLFDMAGSLLSLISPWGEYETRHLLGGMVGVLGLAGVWRLGRLLGGERAGFLALLLLALAPSFIGHSFNNPKDGPFATAMLWAVHALCLVLAELPRPRWRTALWFGVTVGLAMGIRVGALLLLPYLLVALTLYAVGVWWRERGLTFLGDDLWAAATRLLPALALGYLVMCLLWPYAYQTPFAPVEVLMQFSELPLRLDTLFRGQWLPASDLPWTYLPVYLLVKLPEITLIGLALAGAGGVYWLLGLPRRDEISVTAQQVLVVIAAVAAPLAYFLLFRPTAYGEMRHFLFVLPPLAVLGALGFELAAETASAWSRRFLAASLALMVTAQAAVIVHLHPNQYIYYNTLTGGVPGAAGRFELDYWSSSIKEAGERLAQHLALVHDGHVDRQYVVAVCGGPLAASYWFPPYMVFTDKLPEADFLIAFTHAGCDRNFAGRTIIAVERFGVPLSVVKDLRPNRR